jgi:Matrixin
MKDLTPAPAKDTNGNTLLSSTENNNQVAAIKSFLGLYDITQKNNGSWNAIVLTNEVQGSNTIKTALFGDGEKDGGLINKVLVGGTKTKQNPLYNINTILGRLGVNVKPEAAHHNHFHIYLRVPKILTLSQNLLAENSGDQAQSDASSATNLNSANHALGVTDMFFPALDTTQPIIQAEQAVYVSAKASKNPSKNKLKPQLILEECIGLETQTDQGEIISMAGALSLYWSNKFKLKDVPDFKNAKITILKQPEHGVLTDVSRVTIDGPLYRYTAKVGYTGIDKFSYIISVDGMNVQMNEILHVVPVYTGEYEKFCANTPHYIKKIGILDTDTSSINLASLQKSSNLMNLLADASRAFTGFSDLAGTAVGLATGNSITLDTNAAGHGWFVDTTPDDNSEFLATSDPNVWIARAGSAADGKMDMLSVLLHEYGHVIGLDHSADSSDALSPVLQPGVRKLWSETDLAKLNEIIYLQSISPDQLPVDFPSDYPSNGLPPAQTRASTPVARRPRRDTDVNIDLLSDAKIEALNAINPTLTGGDLLSPQGWETTGAVNIANGRATLAETARSQSRLTQGFVLSSQDRYLSFTVEGLQMTDSTVGPDDAIETNLHPLYAIKHHKCQYQKHPAR